MLNPFDFAQGRLREASGLGVEFWPSMARFFAEFILERSEGLRMTGVF